MSDGTKIEWTDATWNVVNGCSVVSPGCKHCYAMKQAHRFPVRQGLTQHTAGGMVWTGEVRFNSAVLDQPLRWKRPRKIFVCAHGDLFHEKVPDAWIDLVFAVMKLAPQHVFQVLTKRPERMRKYVTDDSKHRSDGRGLALEIVWERAGTSPFDRIMEGPWPLPNVWLGTSVEDQQRADERIPVLLDTPATVRWLSCEPLLGPVDLSEWFVCPNWSDDIPMDMTTGLRECCAKCDYTGIGGFSGLPIVDWVVVGGESGPGSRPMHPKWARSLRDQCEWACVPFLFKQWGEWTPMPAIADHPIWGEPLSADRITLEAGAPLYRVGKKVAGRLLDGVQHDGYPA